MGPLREMGQAIQVALVGDYNPGVAAHRAIPLALELAATVAHVQLDYRWLPTSCVKDTDALIGFEGIWCVPASPYLNMDGALVAIRYAREQRLPFLGTCGGFQHAVLEYARNQLGWQDVEHAETSPDSEQAIITPLSCSLVDVMADIRLVPDTLIAEAYGTLDISERYQCRYGLRSDCYPSLFSDALKVGGQDASGEIRAVELQGHPFFVATLFQPERAALQGQLPPLVAAFVRACVQRVAKEEIR
jgi:CTP synthase (UTP-ammonia lyase)